MRAVPPHRARGARQATAVTLAGRFNMYRPETFWSTGRHIRIPAAGIDRIIPAISAGGGKPFPPVRVVLAAPGPGPEPAKAGTLARGGSWFPAAAMPRRAAAGNPPWCPRGRADTSRPCIRGRGTQPRGSPGRGAVPPHGRTGGPPGARHPHPGKGRQPGVSCQPSRARRIRWITCRRPLHLADGADRSPRLPTSRTRPRRTCCRHHLDGRVATCSGRATARAGRPPCWRLAGPPTSAARASSASNAACRSPGVRPPWFPGCGCFACPHGHVASPLPLRRCLPAPPRRHVLSLVTPICDSQCPSLGPSAMNCSRSTNYSPGGDIPVLAAPPRWAQDRRMSGTGPTARTRAISAHLRDLRERERLRRDEAATRLGWSLAKLTRFELGTAAPSVADTLALCQLYGRRPRRPHPARQGRPPARLVGGVHRRHLRPLRRR